MRIFVTLIIVTSMLFTSCGNNQTKEAKKEKEAIEQSSDTKKFKTSKDCDEFLDQYEEWLDSYMVVMEKYMKNPMDTSLAQEFQKVGQEGANWLAQWNSKLMHCASVEKYQKRMDKITDKANKKLEEIGIK